MLQHFAGVVLVILNGMLKLKLSPVGDFLALLTALSWALYGIIIKPIAKEYNNFLISRKLMLYALITSTPILLFEGKPFDWAGLCSFGNISGLLFLSVCCSAVCYILWNQAIKDVGVIRSNYFIYVSPIITLIAGSIILDEIITLMGVCGMLIVIIGMVVGTMERSPKNGG